MTNAERVMDYFVNDEWDFKKSDNLRLIKDQYTDIGIIKYQNNITIGKLVSLYNETDYCSDRFLILTMKDYKSHKGFKAAKNALVKAAHKYDIFVMYMQDFMDEFGIDYKEYSTEEVYDQLLSICPKDIGEDANCICLMQYNHDKDIPIIYVPDYDAHTSGTEVLNRYIEDLQYDNELDELYIDIKHLNKFICLRQPIYTELRTMIDLYAKIIYWSLPHNISFNTHLYYTLSEDIIFNEIKCKKDNSKIIYNQIDCNKNVNKFYDKLKETK